MTIFSLRASLACGAALILAACQPAEVTDAPEAGSETSATEAAAPAAACNTEQRAQLRAARPELEAAALEAAAASRGQGAPALWKMADEDTTIYFLGTVHLLRPELEWQTPEIEQAIAEADTVVF